MRLSDFKYTLPEKLIAQEPLKERDKSRLLVMDRVSGAVEHRIFKDVVELFGPNDVLVVNDTRVVKARLTGYKEKTDAEIEVFLLRELNENMWEIMVKPARKVRMGNTITLQEGITCDIIDNTTSGGRVVRVNYDGDFHKIIEKYGSVPLPPYIRRTPDKKDEKNYQTIFADEGRSGAVAAPTAGLHFTKRLLGRLEKKGVAIVPVTLHVSLGTFRPVNVEDLTRHRMDSEHYIVTRETARTVNDRIKCGRWAPPLPAPWKRWRASMAASIPTRAGRTNSSTRPTTSRWWTGSSPISICLPAPCSCWCRPFPPATTS